MFRNSTRTFIIVLVVFFLCISQTQHWFQIVLSAPHYITNFVLISHDMAIYLTWSRSSSQHRISQKFGVSNFQYSLSTLRVWSYWRMNTLSLHMYSPTPHIANHHLPLHLNLTAQPLDADSCICRACAPGNFSFLTLHAQQQATNMSFIWYFNYVLTTPIIPWTLAPSTLVPRHA